MNDVERYEWAEKILSFKNESTGTVDQEALKAFAEKGIEGASNEDLAIILNLVQDLSNNDQAKESSDSADGEVGTCGEDETSN